MIARGKQMEYSYSLQHTWVQLLGKSAKIGISSVVRREVGEVVYIDLPQVNDRIEKDSLLCVVESSKAALEILSPLTGKVLKVNNLLQEDASQLNQPCQQKGWIVEIEVENPAQLKLLIDEKQYLSSLKENE